MRAMLNEKRRVVGGLSRVFTAFGSRLVAACVVGAVVAWPASPALAQDGNGYETQELVVFLAHVDEPLANADGLFRSTLPARFTTARGRDIAAMGRAATPIGLVTFRGAPPASGVTVSLVGAAAADRLRSAGPGSTWGGESSAWRVVPTDAPALPLPGDWLTPVTTAVAGADARWAVTDKPVPERALVFDLVGGQRPLMACNGSDGRYAVHLSSGFAGESVTAFVPVLDDAGATVGWRSGKATLTADGLAGRPAVDTLTRLLEQAPVGELVIDEAVHATPEAALAGWRASLLAAGLGEPEVAVALRVLADVALTQPKMTVVYRLPDAVLDEWAPLAYDPAPAARHRVGLMVLVGQDPELENRVQTLITSLGDDAWAEREAAQAALLEIGDDAVRLVREGLASDDVEVRYRCELLLSAMGVGGGESRDANPPVHDHGGFGVAPGGGGQRAVIRVQVQAAGQANVRVVGEAVQVELIEGAVIEDALDGAIERVLEDAAEDD